MVVALRCDCVAIEFLFITGLFLIPIYFITKQIFNKNIGLSTEDFVTAPVDYSLLLDRWTELFPTSKVLIVIRSQPDLIYSWYVQLINAGYFRNIHQFTREIMWDRQRSIWSRLNYDSVARLTIEKFTDVKILIYETMLTDYDGYIRELDSFFGRDLKISNLKQRGSPSENTVSIMRTLNRLFRHGYGLSMMSIQPSYNVGPGRREYDGWWIGCISVPVIGF